MSHSPQDVHKKVLGKKGEALAAAFFKKRGCKLLKKNYRTPFGEADLIFEDGDEIVFVEVKTRSSEKFGTAREAVTLSKQRRYYKIAQLYGLSVGEEINVRFDVIEVDGEGKIEYYKNAF